MPKNLRRVTGLGDPRFNTLWEKLDYMHANPVKEKRVGHPRDWPWSSWSFYMKKETGLIRMDVSD
jgi:hypothetical protein